MSGGCKTKICAGDGIADISELLPKTSAVTVIGSSAENAGEYMRKLRRAGFAPKFVKAERTARAINRINVDDDVRMIVSVGGEREADCAKRLSKVRNLPVYAVINVPSAVTTLTQQCALYDGCVLSLAEGNVPLGVAATDLQTAPENALADALGGICAAASGLFDSEAYLVSKGKSLGCKIRDEAFSLIYEALDAAQLKTRRAPDLKNELARISVALAALAQENGVVFVRGAADDCARTAEMLFRREQRNPLGRGEFAFIFGCVLSKTYIEFVNGETRFTPPPDNNLRAELLCEYLGFDALTAARATLCRVKQVGLAEYRMREYRDELASLAGDVSHVFDEAKRTFRRMYPDDGYSLTGRITSDDVRTVIALAPDTFTVAGSALTLMREFGLLDRYLF